MRATILWHHASVPTLLLLCGPSLAGKSTLARRIADDRGLEVVSFDAINLERALPFGAEDLPEATWGPTLEIAEARTRDLLEAGRSVIVDDTLCYRWIRDRFRALGVSAGCRVELLWLRASPEMLQARRRQLAASGARSVLSATTLAAHLAAFEPPGADEPHTTIATPVDTERWLAEFGA